MRNAILVLSLAGAACAGTAPSVEAPTAAVTPATGKTYAIHFGRPSHAGERSHVVTDRSEDRITTITRDGALVSERRDQHTVHYDAVSTVVAADSQGRATRVRFDVKELTSDGRRLPASVIELTRHAREKDAEIVVDGSPANDDVRKALSSMFKLGLDGATDDEVFGTKTPQPIGAHWGIDGARAALSFKEEDGLDVSSIKGDVWLDGTTRVDGAECLAVRAVLDISGIRVPDVPEGSVTEESRAEAEIRTALPIDGRVERAAEHESLTMSFRVRVPAPEGAPMMVTVQGKQSQDARETAL